MGTFINCCFSWSPKPAYKLKRLKYCGRCFPLSATSPFSNDSTAISTCSHKLLPSYPGSGSSLAAQWQKNTTSLPNTDRISGEGATKMYSLSRVGGFKRTLAANHCRTAAEFRICWHSVSYLQMTKITDLSFDKMICNCFSPVLKMKVVSTLINLITLTSQSPHPV